MKLKKIYLFLFFIIDLQNIFANEILLKPIEKITLYNNLNIDELNPFVYSTKKIYLDENSILKLMEEYDYTNGFYNDIFKVVVINGPYKGEIGYVYEDKVCFYKTKKCTFFFKKDYNLEEVNLTIKKSTKALLIENYVVSGSEILKLKILGDKDFLITVFEKEFLQIILDISQEIDYHLKNKAKVIKIVDATTLLPIDNAFCKDLKSDSNGIIYLYNFNENILSIEKKGFSKAFVDLKDNEDILLVFLIPVEKIRYYDGRETVFEADNYKLIIDSKSFGANSELSFAELGLNDLSIFAFPELEEEIKIKGGFFIDEIKEKLNVTLELKNFSETSFLLFYDFIRQKWEKIKKERFNNKNQVRQLKNGYYIIAEECEKKSGKIIIFNNGKSSKKYIKNRKGDYYKVIKSNEKFVSVSDDEYEIIYFDKNKSVLNHILFRGEKIVYSIIENELSSKILPEAFNGLWEKRIVKGEYKRENSLEALGDMIIEPNGRIRFKSKNFVASGNYEIIDENKIIIHIRRINMPVKILNSNEIVKVDSSIFNSQLVIYGNYKYYMGVFELAFDNVYLSRVMNFIFKIKNGEEITLESEFFYRTNFPENEHGKYKIYFVKK